MNRLKLHIQYSFFIYMFTPLLSFAGDVDIKDATGRITIDNPIAAKSLPEFFKAMIMAFTQLGTIVAVLAIMYGGFQYATAQGNEEKLAQAQKTVTWALVGTALLIGAQVIMTAVTGTIKKL